MYSKPVNKKKIINDPVYGFINIPSKLIFNIIEHPYFQRLRRIKQLSLTSYIYPGANHTRFHHSIGAMHLMMQAIESINNKKQQIDKQEAKAVTQAILLHDIGHGPFSHTLEYSILSQTSHEKVTEIFIQRLNEIFEGKLSLAIQIFKGKYSKKYLHQLVSSQLDMDRLDYLRRDSFFTGVIEGNIGSDRIIKMLDVVNDELVVEAKGIYSVENFLIARRLMYWQVYLHKTVVAAEEMLIQIIKRAKKIISEGGKLFATPAFGFFLHNNLTKDDLESKILVENKLTALDLFAKLDDSDIWASIKSWTNHKDMVLSFLSSSLLNRKLFATEIKTTPFSEDYIKNIKKKCMKKFKFSKEETEYLVISNVLVNNAYSINNDKINIKSKNGVLMDIAEASDISNVNTLSKVVKKYFICYPKEIYA